jgi:hypothetical protein
MPPPTTYFLTIFLYWVEEKQIKRQKQFKRFFGWCKKIKACILQDAE